MTVTMQRWLGVALLLSLTASGSQGDDAKPQQLPGPEKVVKALEALGGEIVRDKGAKGKPIVEVDLNGKQQMTDEDLKGFQELKELRSLRLAGTQVTDAGLKELKGLTKLWELRLDVTQVTDAGLKELKDLKGLQRLGLSGTQVTDAGLKELKGLKELQELRLGGTQVTDAGLKELKELKKLRALGLAGTQVTDAGLKELKNLKELRELRIDGTQTTDAGLKELRQLKELRRLNLNKTRVTNAGVDDLQKALPALEIEPKKLKGEVKSINFDSKHLGETREVMVYLPPGHDRNKSYPVIYAADAFDGVACELIEPLITSGKVPPIVIVGTANGGEKRPLEYLPGRSPKHFKAHEKFFIEEVIPWAERKWGASRERKDRVVYGSSNSGPFALTMANKHPDLFGHVFAMMVYGLRFRDFESELKKQPKKDPTHYILVVGSRDEHGIEENQMVEEILKKNNFPVSSSIIKGGGHSHQLQREQLPRCIEATFGKKK